MKQAWGMFLLLFAVLCPAVPRAEVAAPLPNEVLLGGVEFVRIPAGYFWYSVQTGSRATSMRARAPAYREVRVWLDEYYIGKYEARARDFVRFMNATAPLSDWYGDPQYWYAETHGCAVHFEPGAGFRERYPGADYPATGVSHDLAREFSRWMGFRLPNEAEWQKAARGTDKRIWPWGNDYPDETYANLQQAAGCAPEPVTAYPKGRSPYGVYNMAGNVAETTANWYNHAFDQGLRDGVRNPPPPAEPEQDDPAFVEKRFTKGGRTGSLPGAAAIAVRVPAFTGGSGPGSGLRFAVDASVVRAHLRGQAVLPRHEPR